MKCRAEWSEFMSRARWVVIGAVFGIVGIVAATFYVHFAGNDTTDTSARRTGEQAFQDSRINLETIEAFETLAFMNLPYIGSDFPPATKIVVLIASMRNPEGRRALQVYREMVRQDRDLQVILVPPNDREELKAMVLAFNHARPTFGHAIEAISMSTAKTPEQMLGDSGLKNPFLDTVTETYQSYFNAVERRLLEIQISETPVHILYSEGGHVRRIDGRSMSAEEVSFILERTQIPFDDLPEEWQ